MPHPSPPRAAPLALLAALLLALLASAPSAQAWVCMPDPQHVCELVQDTTGVIVDIATSPEGYGVIVMYTMDDQQHQAGLTLCVHGTKVWLSATGYCTTPPQSPRDRISYLLP